MFCSCHLEILSNFSFEFVFCKWNLMNIRACAKTLEPSAHMRSAGCQLPTSWQPASSPVSLAVCFLSPGAWSPAHLPPTFPHPSPGQHFPLWRGQQQSYFHSMKEGVGVSMFCCGPLHPVGSWTQDLEDWGWARWGVLRQGWQQPSLPRVGSTTTISSETLRGHVSCPPPIQVLSKSQCWGCNCFRTHCQLQGLGQEGGSLGSCEDLRLPHE